MILIEVLLLNVFGIFLLTPATSGNDDLTPDEIIDLINSSNSSWTAGYTNLTEEDLLVRARAIVDKDCSTNVKRVIHDPDFIANLPESFDAREQWSNCPSISHIRDQGPCGNCWAVAIAGAITDRYCIKSNGTKQFTYSAQDLTSCDTSNNGCNGGAPECALDFWVSTGLVSGGDYDSSEGCYPYEIMPGPPDIPDQVVDTPPCRNICRAGYDKEYLQDKNYGQNVISLISEGDMMAEIYKNGPIVTSFRVFGDFSYYTSGIYRNNHGEFKTMHTVRIIGWGVEDGKKYWLVANSWGPKWALEEGYFRIIRGQNECDFETNSYIAEAIV